MHNRRWMIAFFLGAALLLIAFLSNVDFAARQVPLPDDFGEQLREWITITITILLILGPAVMLVYLIMNRVRGEFKDKSINLFARIVTYGVIILVLLAARSYLENREPVEIEEPEEEEQQMMDNGFGSYERGEEIDRPRGEPEEVPPIIIWMVFGGVVLLGAAGIVGIFRYYWAQDEDDSVVDMYQEELEAMSTIVLATLSELENEPDPRRAIVRCYLEFQRLLLKAGLPVPKHLAPEELLEETLRRFPVPKEPLETLTWLFQRAKFSVEVINDSDKQMTIRCFRDIRDALSARIDEKRG